MSQITLNVDNIGQLNELCEQCMKLRVFDKQMPRLLIPYLRLKSVELILGFLPVVYRISSFKHHGVYLILGLLGASFNSKSKQKKMKSDVSIQSSKIFL